MYFVHSYEKGRELLESSKIEIFYNDNFNERKEDIMEKKNVQSLESETKNNSNPPVWHFIYKALQLKGFFCLKLQPTKN
jgi:hypothetical protein